ncbi:hypothetical protein CEXT_164331 [Caerostris extrusa]|uniref:Uncharacterized protein n=1 Tax=Caerostris extrusa TaxID=172846 RepID=A0AAV4QJ23_CAEEX|nr:hypothetical protein CEXT_164331 [Caerostris extrusa]
MQIEKDAVQFSILIETLTDNSTVSRRCVSDYPGRFMGKSLMYKWQYNDLCLALRVNGLLWGRCRLVSILVCMGRCFPFEARSEMSELLIPVYLKI